MAQAPLAVPAHPWTVDDLMTLPDDSLRYEIVDGSLHVSPLPAAQHGLLATRLYDVLRPGVPKNLLLLVGGVGVSARPLGRELQFLIPDLLVVRSDAAPLCSPDAIYFSPEDVPLVVEVVSPSSVTHDLVTKRDLYALLAIPHYWVVREERSGITVRLLELHDGAYVEEA
ncbi:MAG: Uma2 family endonuclease [Actinomycetota bacterium]|nr:Uma2 family endonuclease [Actinomycetota bacterium]